MGVDGSEVERSPTAPPRVGRMQLEQILGQLLLVAPEQVARLA